MEEDLCIQTESVFLGFSDLSQDNVEEIEEKCRILRASAIALSNFVNEGLNSSHKKRTRKTVLTTKSKYFTRSTTIGPVLKLSHAPIWTPPKSPYNLIQETLFSNPWKLLLATIFLNKTSGKVAVPILNRFLSKWSTPQATIAANFSEVVDLIQPLGLQHKRAKIIQKFSGMLNLSIIIFF